MTHADALRAWAAQYATHTARAQFLAGADALEAIGRVRHALSSIARVRSESEASARDDDEIAEWHEATADALEYAIDLITEALEGDHE